MAKKTNKDTTQAQKTVSELHAEAVVLEKQLVLARMDHKMGRLKNTMQLSKLRKQIARLKTSARELELKATITQGEV